MRNRWMRLLCLFLAFGLVAAACGSDDDDAGEDGETGVEGTEEMTEETSDEEPTEEMTEEPTEEMTEEAGGEGDGSVTITGPERDESEAGAIQQVMDAFGEENGIEITYVGSADWEAEINLQIEGGNPPNISIFPQPGKLADFAREGHVVALSDDVVNTAGEYWLDSWLGFGNVDGTQYGVPVKTDLKSLVWYQPARFEEAGYEIPETWDDLKALADTIIADGGTPWCIGIESGQATGWTFTDWVEDVMLRLHGPDVYDQWVNHEIPFNDERVVAAMDEVLSIWNTDGAVFSSGGSIAATAFQDNGQPLVDGECFMHRQANFYTAFIPEGTAFADGSPDAVDVFYLPDVNGDKPVLVAGTLAAGFDDDPNTMAVLEYMATADYADARQAAQTELKGGGLSGFLSAAQGQDPNNYQPIEQSFLEILENSEIARFDASDLMPADVGAGTFWSEGTSAVNGDITAQEAADAIEESWPS